MPSTNFTIYIKRFKLVYFAFALCFITLRAHGQIKISTGVKGGVTCTTMKAKNEDTETTIIGGALGINTNFTFKEFFSIQAEFLILQKGATATINGGKKEIKLHYFQIPILFKLNAPIHKTFYPHVFAGPGFAYRVDATYTSTKTTFKNQSDLNIDNLRKYENVGIFGIGLDIKKNKLSFNIDVRYGCRLYKTENKNYHLSFKNTDLSMLAGIEYRIASLK